MKRLKATFFSAGQRVRPQNFASQPDLQGLPPPRPEFSPESVAYLKAQARQRRRREFAAVILLLLFIALSTWGMMSYFGTDSWIYLALVNFNFVLMLVVLFLVGRNVVKLALERRHRLFGARLRTRLLLSFISISLIPVVLMFLAANRVLNASVDYWFKSQVENSMLAALEVGQSFYNTAAQRLRANSILLLDELGNTDYASPEAEGLLWRWRRESSLSLVGFIDRSEGNPPAFLESNWHIDPHFAPEWASARNNINWDTALASGYDSLLWPTSSADYVFSVMPVPGNNGMFLVSAESIGRGLLRQLDSIAGGFEEYSRLKNLRRPLKISFSFVLGLLSLTIVFSAVWIAFRLSRQILQPILALAQGTDEMARGRLDFQVQDTGKDELGQLVASFNRMTQEVRESHARLKTANRQLEDQTRELTERNAYIETVLDNITTGVVTLDPQGRIVTMNKAVASMFSTNAELWQGRSPVPFLQADYVGVFQGMFEFLHGHPGRVWQKEQEFLWRGRGWRLLIHAVLLPVSSGAPENGSVVAVIEDITELARMQRMAAWQEVAKRIAHEIKNPLTPIKLSAQRLERKFGPDIGDDIFHQCTDLIVREADRLERMVGEFSSFASLPEVRLVKGKLTPIAREAVELFRTSHRDIHWSFREPENLPEMRLDAEALHRALVNVLKNAAEALAGKQDTDKKVEVRLSAAPSGVLVLEVEDNGPGLPGEDRDRIFEPYFSRKGGGTGLGLSIVRSIIKDHEGDIRAETALHGGTIIRMEFPY